MCLLDFFTHTYCVFYTIQVAGGGQHSAIIGKVVTAAWEIESDEEEVEEERWKRNDGGGEMVKKRSDDD